MTTTRASGEADPERPQVDVVERVTTQLELERLDDDRWMATQIGVDVRGHAESAPRAVMEYCRCILEADGESSRDQ